MVTGYKELDIAVLLEHKKQELERFMDEIGVSSEQKTKLQTVVRETKSQIVPILDQLFDRTRQLLKYAASPQATEAETLIRAKELEDLRSEVTPIRVKALFKVKTILTPEQQEKFGGHIQERMQEFQQKLSTFMHLSP